MVFRVGRTAINAAEIAAVGDRDPAIGDGASELVLQGHLCAAKCLFRPWPSSAAMDAQLARSVKLHTPSKIVSNSGVVGRCQNHPAAPRSARIAESTLPFLSREAPKNSNAQIRVWIWAPAAARPLQPADAGLFFPNAVRKHLFTAGGRRRRFRRHPRSGRARILQGAAGNRRRPWGFLPLRNRRSKNSLPFYAAGGVRAIVWTCAWDVGESKPRRFDCRCVSNEGTARPRAATLVCGPGSARCRCDYCFAGALAAGFFIIGAAMADLGDQNPGSAAMVSFEG